MQQHFLSYAIKKIIHLNPTELNVHLDTCSCQGHANWYHFYAGMNFCEACLAYDLVSLTELSLWWKALFLWSLAPRSSPPYFYLRWPNSTPQIYQMLGNTDAYSTDCSRTLGSTSIIYLSFSINCIQCLSTTGTSNSRSYGQSSGTVGIAAGTLCGPCFCSRHYLKLEVFHVVAW